MIEVLYRYHVHPAQQAAFRQAYGPKGPWARLFGEAPGFVRTRLFAHRAEPNVFVTIDVWESKTEYDRFRSERAQEYGRLDRELHLLYLEELLLGYYEGADEYRAPLDTMA